MLGVRIISEQYQMIAGKRNECHNEANEHLFHFVDSLDMKEDMRVALEKII